MTVQWSTTLRDALLDSWETTIGTSAKIHVYSGTPPAAVSDAATGTELVTYALGSDWASAAASGAKSLSSTPIAGTAIAAGTAGYYRITDSAGTTCHEQGTITVTGSGGDMTIDNAVIADGQTVNITGFTKTAPGA